MWSLMLFTRTLVDQSLTSLTGNPLLMQFYRYTVYRAGLSQNTRRHFKEEGITEVIRDADAGPCVPTVRMICAVPLYPWDVKQKVKALKISVADSMQLSTKLLAYGSCFKDINTILNYCLHTEGLNEATLRTIYHSVVTWGRYRDEKTSKRGNHV